MGAPLHLWSTAAVVSSKASKPLAALNVSATRKRPEVVLRLVAFLGISRDDIEAWLAPLHGRTKLPNAFGRLWPTQPDSPAPRGEFSTKLAALRNSDARHSPAHQVALAKILGAAPSVVEADLRAEHHRLRLEKCVFSGCEQAYADALAKRGAGPSASDSADPFAPHNDNFGDTAPAATEGPTVDTAGNTDSSPLPPELAGIRVSEARKDDLLIFRLCEVFDQSPGMIRAALDRSHHRQRLDSVDFTPQSKPTQEFLGLSTPAPASPATSAAASTSSQPSMQRSGSAVTTTPPGPGPSSAPPDSVASASSTTADYRQASVTANSSQLPAAADRGASYTAELPSALPKRPARVGDDAIPKPGQIARCRHRNWLVETVHPPRELRRNATHLVDLVCIDDDVPGRKLSVLWELELGAYLTEPETGQLRGLGGFDPPEQFAAYLNTLRWNATTAADPNLFQAPLRAGIHVQPYQLTPLKKALELPRANLFIADDVGLGKTIEAGLVLQELLLRQRVDFALVVAPASVCLQWKEELYKRFGLHFRIYDRAFVARTRQQRGYKVNPWTAHTRFIISYPLLRRAEYLEPLRAFLGEYGAHRKRPKSLLILDEAHTVAPASGGSYAIDSRITRVAREHLCPRFENRLFLSATPHNGHSNSFSALLELLDPQRFHRSSPAAAADLQAVMVRRLKRNIRRVADGLFPRREVVALTLRGDGERWTVSGSLHAPRPEIKGYSRPELPLADDVWPLPASEAPELELSRLLGEYEAIVSPRNKKQRLVFANLQKRLLSSIPAFCRTLTAHAQRFDPAFAASLDAAPEPLIADTNDSEFDRDDNAIEAEELEQTAAASKSLQKPSQQAKALLDEMLALAEQHRRKPDMRVRALLEWIRRNQCPGVGRAKLSGTHGTPEKLPDKLATWGPRKLLIFTEYTDTKKWLSKLLTRAFAGTEQADERLLEIQGNVSDKNRETIQKAFNAPPGQHPVRILLATDAAREGINLQGACADLLHFDIPWNPARLEQRNGRIDRTLQPEPEARCHYFIYADREEDVVLDTVVRKVDIIRDELGSVGSVVMEQISEAMAGRSIRKDSRAAVEAAANPGARQQVVLEELEKAQAKDDARLDKEIRRAGSLFSKAQETFNFKPHLLRQAIDVALSLLGVTPLTPIAGEDGSQAYSLPEFPPGWESSLDALRRPRDRDESLWDWRRAAPPQPVVFDPPPHMTSPRVHLHLHHPLVRRLLDIFTSTGFGAHQLEHLTLMRHEGGSAYAVALARVSLFGTGAVRLHDELVEHYMRIGGDAACGPLEQLTEREIGKLSGNLEEQLRMPKSDRPPPKIAESLLHRARDDFATLWPLVHSDGQRIAEQAGRRLRERGNDESRQLRQILDAQKNRLQQQLPLLEVTTVAIERQRKAEAKARSERLAAIDREIQTEPTGLAEMYRVQLCRIEPVGLVYLWPEVWG